MKILIIEDEVEISNSICEYLKNEKFICETAFDYMSAIEKIAMYEYTCILLDIGLPAEAGLICSRNCRKQIRTMAC